MSRPVADVNKTLVLILICSIVGLSDAKNEGLFQWSDGRPMIYASWYGS